MIRPLGLALLLLLWTLPVRAGVIEGRVMLGEAPREGVTVSAHPSLDPNSPPVASTRSAADGRYRLELPAGRYALFAREATAKLFGFCGRNPLEVGGETPTWAGIQLVPAGTTVAVPGDDPYGATIEGRVLLGGVPLADAVVTLYLDLADDLKGQGYRHSLPTAADGLFAFDGLPEADYHLVARKRAGGNKAGPVRDGDDLAFFSGNPLRAVAGRTTTVELHAVRKVREMESDETEVRPGGPTLRGKIVDPGGQPLGGLHVFAYTDKVIGHKRPAAISPPTAGDGVFQLVLPRPGLYYVGAREGYGDSPAPGERFGMYDDSADHGIEVGPGGVATPVRIVVEPVLLH